MFDHSVLIEESERNTKMRKIYRYVMYVTFVGELEQKSRKSWIFLRVFPTS